MNQAETRRASGAIETVGVNGNQSKSTGACCCAGKNAGIKQAIEIGSDKTMNESRENENQTTTVTAPEIVCDGCAASIKKAFGNVAGVSEVEVDVASKQVTVNHDRSVSREKIVDVLDQAGYEVAQS
jgi:copper chaperone